LESVLPLTPRILYEPLHPLQTTTDLLFSFADRCALAPPVTSLPPLVTRPLLPATKLSHPLQASFDPLHPLADRYKTPLTRYEHLVHLSQATLTCYGPLSILYNLCRRPALHNMADIRRQIDDGQKKWRQGPDLTSANDINDYVKFKTLEYAYYKFTNDDLWEQYKEDFAGFTEAIFKTCSICKLRILLRDQGVWVARNRQITTARSLYNTLYEEDPVEWSKEEILEQIRAKGPFKSYKLNRISGVIDNSLNHQIREMDWTGLVIIDSNVQVTDQDPDEPEALLPTPEATLHESIVPQGPTDPLHRVVKDTP
jgi:SNF2 family DNA or RNA helicase